jgi:hypothetical protein
MQKIILKHLTVTGYRQGIDLTECELSAKKLEEAKDKLKDAKKEVKAAKSELKQALEDSIKKIENEKSAEKKIRYKDSRKSAFKSAFGNKEIKAKYEKKLAEFEEKKSDMKKKLSEYKSNGNEKWESLKRELNKDLDGIEKGFMEFIIDNKKKVKELVS